MLQAKAKKQELEALNKDIEAFLEKSYTESLGQFLK